MVCAVPEAVEAPADSQVADRIEGGEVELVNHVDLFAGRCEPAEVTVYTYLPGTGLGSEQD